MSLLWQIIISVGSGIGGVIVGGLLNHSLMIRQEHKLRIFNARIEAFSAFSNNTHHYTKTDIGSSDKYLFLNVDNGAILKRIKLIGSKDITSKCASLLIDFLSSKPLIEISNKLVTATIKTADDLFELFSDCMKYDLAHTKINLNQKPRGKDARSLEKQVNEMGKKLFPSLNS